MIGWRGRQLPERVSSTRHIRSPIYQGDGLFGQTAVSQPAPESLARSLARAQAGAGARRSGHRHLSPHTSRSSPLPHLHPTPPPHSIPPIHHHPRPNHPQRTSPAPAQTPLDHHPQSLLTVTDIAPCSCSAKRHSRASLLLSTSSQTHASCNPLRRTARLSSTPVFSPRSCAYSRPRKAGCRLGRVQDARPG